MLGIPVYVSSLAVRVSALVLIAPTVARLATLPPPVGRGIPTSAVPGSSSWLFRIFCGCTLDRDILGVFVVSLYELFLAGRWFVIGSSARDHRFLHRTSPWYLDSGASFHMTSESSILSALRSLISPVRVVTADGTSIPMSFPFTACASRRAPARYSPSRMVSVVSEPTSYRDAECHPEWQLAMAEEIAALERTGTWDLVSPLLVFVLSHEHGRDYDETFAPVAHMTTVRTLLAVASVRRCLPLDVQNAFLNGELSEEVYMQPPPGYSVPDGMVCRLRRSLYGLKQAPRAWFERFASVVTAAGFSPSLHDPALFVHTSPRGRTLLLLYVDDMIITGDDPEYIAFVKARLRDRFL
ncbi:hypothetical protein QYE76_049324 [Lolium multiflorum]|uniref:Reverse transcriptase Ty1/copia-type domain-containing protein n=1 Tax=Lolium multiflorum TaxID=4521 RepID=A0AAD8WI74_LOLMU|nr:hypothetical protein QYE76_049324 [Lolium multiflorum]